MSSSCDTKQLESDILQNIIKFRQLISNLSKKELCTFQTELMKKCGKEIFIDAFCHRYLENQEQNKANNNIKKMSVELNEGMQIVNKIIHLRNTSSTTSNDKKEKGNGSRFHNQTIPPERISHHFRISLLPTELINGIASYFKQKDYANFALSNRTIYVACNNPNASLTQINLTNVPKANLPKNILRYTFIKSLAISVSYKYVSDYYRIKHKHEIFPKLTRLFLYGQDGENVDCSIVHSLFEAEDSMIDRNLIRHLSLKRFGALSYNQLLDILKLCPNIEYLHVHDTQIIGTSSDFETNVRKILLNLKGFGIFCNDTKLTDILIQEYGNDITYLGSVDAKDNIIIPTSINFEKLLDLYMYRTSSQTFKMILQKAKMLRSITLQKHDQDIWKILPLIFVKQRYLQSLTIIENTYKKWNDITDAIEKAIYQFNHYESHNLSKYSQIRIAVDFWIPTKNNNDTIAAKHTSQPTLDSIFMKLTRIINEISLFSFTVDFVLKIEFCGRFDGDLEAQCQLFRKKYHNIKLECFSIENNKSYCEDMDLIITNKSNSMNGWSDGHITTMAF